MGISKEIVNLSLPLLFVYRTEKYSFKTRQLSLILLFFIKIITTRDWNDNNIKTGMIKVTFK